MVVGAAAQRVGTVAVLHRLVPVSVAVALQNRLKGAELAEQAMTRVVGATSRRGEVAQLASDYQRYELFRSEMKWRPWLVGGQPVEGVEVFHALAEEGRGAIMNFMHHGLSFAAAASFGAAGVRSHMAFADVYFGHGPGATRAQQAEFRAAAQNGVHPFNAVGSFAQMGDWLDSGEVVALACDLPGSTRARFLGSRIYAASGVARLALKTGAPIVPVSASPAGRLTRFRTQEPIEPGGFSGIEALQAEIFRRHEPAVLAWPEALQTPLERWTPVKSEREDTLREGQGASHPRSVESG